MSDLPPIARIKQLERRNRELVEERNSLLREVDRLRTQESASEYYRGAIEALQSALSAFGREKS